VALKSASSLKTQLSCTLRANEIDGQLLRTGAANFSASGLKRQDNDLIVIKDVQAAAKFRHVFEARFASGKALPIARNDDINYASD
jgi:phosphatidylserine/phosphatidylglycerophosphate/cardiolipin synthase-like enzyme